MALTVVRFGGSRLKNTLSWPTLVVFKNVLATTDHNELLAVFNRVLERDQINPVNVLGCNSRATRHP